MRDTDPEGKMGPKKTLPDAVKILEPKQEDYFVAPPTSEDFGMPKPAAAAEEPVAA